MSNRWTALSMTLLQILLVTEYTGHFGFATLMSLFAIIGTGVQLQLRVSPVWHVVLLLVVGAGLLSANMVHPPEIDPDWFLPARYVVSVAQILIVAQVLEFWLGHPKDPKLIRFSGLALAGFLVCFCRSEQAINSPMFFLSAIAMGIAMLVFGHGVGEQNSNAGNQITLAASRHHWARWIVLCLAVIVLAASTGLAADTAKRTLGLSRYLIKNRTVEAFESRNSRIAYSTSGDLGDITRLKQISPERVALEITCNALPGYIRGRAFTELTMRRWRGNASAVSNLRRITRLMENRPDGQFRSDQSDEYGLFELTPSKDQLREIQIQNSAFYIGEVFFSPLHSHYVEGVGMTMTVDRHQIVRRGISRRQPYVAYVPQESSKVELEPDQIQQLLEVPPTIRQRVKGVASQICATATSDLEKIERVETWFRENYEYSLEPFSAPSADRISWFVLNRPPGHCEYFASAAAVCLRLNGIPARYVTGFGVYQPSESDDNSGEMWIARNQDAHAWVEAFDRENQQWVVVEATPGVNLPKTIWSEGDLAFSEGASIRNSDEAQSESWSQWINLQWSRLMEAGSGYRVVLNLLALIVCVCVFVLLVRRRALGNPRLQYQRKDLARSLRRLDRKLKKLNLVREPAETLHQFSNRLTAYDGQNADWVHDVSHQYVDYAMLRYRTDPRAKII